jgi:DNA-binding GntR family transcriptional regulator
LKRLEKIDDYRLLSHRIYSALKKSIVSGEFQFGEKIYAEQIAKYYQVSATPIREAIHKLVAEGILVQKPNQGTVVKEISLSDIDQILQVRSVIEKMAIRLLIEKIKATEIRNDTVEELHSLIEFMKENLANKNAKNFVKYALDFHRLIFKECGNKYLYKIYRGLEDIFSRFTSKSIDKEGRIQNSYLEQVEIYRSIKEKDLKKAEKCVETYMDNVWKSIKNK